MRQLEFGEIIRTDARRLAQVRNPCIRAFGHGPEGRRCKDCDLFVVLQYSKRYFKCRLRQFTHGPATDHRANWPACGKFEGRNGWNRSINSEQPSSRKKTS